MDFNNDEDLLALMGQAAEGVVDWINGTMYSKFIKEQYNYSVYSCGMMETVLQTEVEDMRRLQNKEADAALKTSADRGEGLWTIVRFAPES